MRAHARPTLLIMFTLAIAMLAAAPRSHAGTYSASVPTAGFSATSGVGLSTSLGGRCQTQAESIAPGVSCQLRWNVPSGLDATQANFSGKYQAADSAFGFRVTMDGTAPVDLTPSTTESWWTGDTTDLGSFVSMHMTNTSGVAQLTTPSSHWFDVQALSVTLVDSTPPVLETLEGDTGWKGSAGACVRYHYSDVGSGLRDVALRTGSGTYIDRLQPNNDGVTNTLEVDRDCVTIPATTHGTRSFYTSAIDKSGAFVSTSFSVQFDLQAPTVGAPNLGSHAGPELTNGQTILTSSGDLRPSVWWDVSDSGSGIATWEQLIDGVVVCNCGNYNVPVDLTPGTHQFAMRVTDNVGNRTTVTRTIHVVDDVAPTVEINSPGTTGTNRPTLDVSATDAHTEIEPTTWTVRVNGVLHAAGSADADLVTALGTLANGDHTITVTVADTAGNATTETLQYTADSGDGVPPMPVGFYTGIHLYATPAAVAEGETRRVAALMVRNGRPVLGRAELRAGGDVLAGADVDPTTGAVDLQVAIDRAGPLELHAPQGSTLLPTGFDYIYTPTTSIDTSGGGTGGTGTNGTTGGGTTTTTSTTTSTTTTTNTTSAVETGRPCGQKYLCDVIYLQGGIQYINGLPLAESGTEEDKTPPALKVRVMKMPKHWVLKTRELRAYMWTTELAVVTNQLNGHKPKATASARRTERAVGFVMTKNSKLYKQIAKAKRGAVIKVRVRLTAVDKNGNSSKPRWYTLAYKF